MATLPDPESFQALLLAGATRQLADRLALLFPHAPPEPLLAQLYDDLTANDWASCYRAMDRLWAVLLPLHPPPHSVSGAALFGTLRETLWAQQPDYTAEQLPDQRIIRIIPGEAHAAYRRTLLKVATDVVGYLPDCDTAPLLRRFIREEPLLGIQRSMRHKKKVPPPDLLERGAAALFGVEEPAQAALPLLEWGAKRRA